MKVTFPEELPVSQRRDEIREALASHQVVIVCGDTGSGKTTQLPKIALEMGFGTGGRRIGCTQPRRIAATSVAKRVADELQVELGNEVGYQIRFEDKTDKEKTCVKFMTDGILLAETRNDPNLRQYDTLIIDEAHERSLNIDFILGYLRRIQKKRRDLKIVVSSATLDAAAFSGFFDDAPVVQVEGRTYPVEDLYQPSLDDREPLANQVGRAVEDLAKFDPLGDTLVFLPGEREIRDAADLLEGRKYRDTLVLPLFARLAAKDQQAVFQPMRSKRRIILATNVAETSLTIPGIRFVVDSGVARMSRHDTGTGIQRLQIEPVSQASARQRRGRCGRVSEGICVRLYSEEEFDERPEFTDPEILRSNLAGVVLQMAHLGLGDPLEFPFIDPPQPKRIAQAYRVLEELGAIWKKGKHVELTEIGHMLARLPVDPRVGRILIGARDENCLQEGLIIASAMTVQDPRERPQEKQQAADEAHRRFRDNRSDFTGWLKWWFAIQEERKKSNNALRRFCQKNFANYRRVQEWMNLHRELRDTLREMRWKLPPPKKALTDPADTYSEPLHRAILSAIPSRIGLHKGKKQGYRGAKNTNFFLFPGSGIFGASPSWVMAFEMVETAKLYARNASVLDPGWVEKVAPHLCRYRYMNPHWVAEQGAVYGEETVIAFGLPVVEKRRVHYARIDAKVAREIFILEALVNGNTRAPMPALKKNRETLAAAERLEHKMRRLGGLMHPEAVVAFYEEVIPPDIYTQKAFEQWVAKQPEGTIDFRLDDCLLPQTRPIRFADYPDRISSPDGVSSFKLVYLHNPSEVADGITMTIPLVELPHLPEWFGDWMVPGWLPEKLETLLRCMRKELRTMLPAMREVADAFLEAWEDYDPQCSLLDALIEFLHEMYGLEITADVFDLSRVPIYLLMRFRILDDHGRAVGEGRDLAELQEQLAQRVRDRFSTVSKGKFAREQVATWDFGDLPEEVELDRHTVGYPRLYDPGGQFCAIQLWASESCAERQHRMGLAKLFQLEEAEKVRRLRDVLFSAGVAKGVPKPVPKKVKAAAPADGFNSMAQAFGGSGARETRRDSRPEPAVRKATSASGLSASEAWLLSQIGEAPGRNRDDLVARVVMDVLGSPLTKGEWVKAKEVALGDLFDRGASVSVAVSRILGVVETVSGLLGTEEAGYEESIADAREHFSHLTMEGWLLAADWREWLANLQGLEMRLTRMLGAPPVKDLQKLERYQELARPLWAEQVSCECGKCLPAMVYGETVREDSKLRMQIFAPELRARLK